MRAVSTLKSLARQISIVIGLLFAFCAVANAYTIVMRDGRRVEIPSQFVVTTSTVTYEVSPGVQITLNISAVDIAATEKINNDPAGSFLQRALTSADLAVENAKPVARRTITNRDLESVAVRRRASEIAYENRRKQLGLPSLEESRREAAAQSASLTSELRRTRSQEQDSEAYWRSRAVALRTEIAALNAESQYVLGQLDQPIFPNPASSFTTVVSVAPFGGFGRFGRQGFPTTPHRPGIFLAPNVSGLRFGGTRTRGQVFVNPLQFHSARSFGGQILPVSNLPFFGSAQPFDYSYERSALITRFNELSATRAGLNARWRELEDEARRAGAPPGWLRP